MASGTFLPPGLSRSIVKIESGGTDNYVMTAVDGETIQGEANLTFDGSKLGVGTSAPSSDLELARASDSGTTLEISNWGTSDASAGSIRFQKSESTTIQTFVVTTGSQLLGSIGWYGTDSGGGTPSASARSSYIQVTQDGTAGAAYVPSYMSFGTGTSSATTERMRIHSTGEIDLKSNALGLTNVGASGNDWTANSLSVNNSNADAAVNMYVRNTSTSASGSSAHLTLWTAATSGTGDPYVSWTRTGGGTWNAGMDVSDSDAFVISNGALGAANAIRIDTSENVYFGSAGTNQDVYFYGDTSPRDMWWDAGANALLIADDVYFAFGNSEDLKIYHSSSSNITYITAANHPLNIDLNGGTLSNVGPIFQRAATAAGVERAVIHKDGIADNTATALFTITTVNESANTDDGAYTCFVKGMIGHRIDTDVGDPAVKGFSAAFARCIAGNGDGANTAVTEIWESLEAGSGLSVRGITTVTMTVAETSEYAQTISIQITDDGSGVNTFEVVFEVEVIWAEFLTPPVIAASA